VSIQGIASVLGPSDEDERRTLARRYLGREGGDAFIEATAGADDVTIELTPEVWRTFDYSESGT
jgi:hypothetical protein